MRIQFAFTTLAVCFALLAGSVVGVSVRSGRLLVFSCFKFRFSNPGNAAAVAARPTLEGQETHEQGEEEGCTPSNGGIAQGKSIAWIAAATTVLRMRVAGLPISFAGFCECAD